MPPTTALMGSAPFGERMGAVEMTGVGAAALGVLMVNRPGLFARRLRRG